MSIAVRVRRPMYLTNYNHEITITCDREDGGPCEWDKMIDNEWADWFFYGITNSNDPTIGDISSWWLIDLQIARPTLIRLKNCWVRKRNKDMPGLGCYFHPIPVMTYIRDSVIEHYGIVEPEFNTDPSHGWVA